MYAITVRNQVKMERIGGGDASSPTSSSSTSFPSAVGSSTSTPALSNVVTPSGNEVDDDLVGLWMRRRITSGGTVDESTIVYYLQTKSGLFADIRIPADCVGILQSGLDSAALSNQDLLTLSKMKGFGGIFECDKLAHTCKWNREIDFQPTAPPEEFLPDESYFRIENGGRILVETGIHEEFEEIWERLTRPEVLTQAFRSVTSVDARATPANYGETQRGGILVTADDYFLVIIDRGPEECQLPRATDLHALVLADLNVGDRKSAVRKLSLVVEFGEIQRPTDSEAVTSSQDTTVPRSFIQSEHNQDAVYMVKYSTKLSAMGKPSITIPSYKWVCVGM